MSEQLLSALAAIFLSLGVGLLYFFGSDLILKKTCRSRLVPPHKAERVKHRIQPWVFLFPALLFLVLFLVYPVFATLKLSFYDKNGEFFVGLFNYRWAFADKEFLEAVGNNLLWLIVVPSLSTLFGLCIAMLTDRLSWGMFARTLIFMPMAISFVGASVIWKFVYDYRGPDSIQIGILNALVQAFGGEPQAWITLPFWNNLFLMAILVWIQTGFAMVILGAALRGVPQETLEAAYIDGANPLQVFLKIMIPQVTETIVVVWTTITILVLKVFDIVLTMTNGQWNTEVLANLMYDWMFRGGGDFGRGSTFAVIIMFAVIPIMIWNIKRSRQNT